MDEGREPTGRFVVFDLDDTLYLERDFAWSGFRAAGDWFRERTGWSGLAGICQELFEAGHRGNIFDRALDRLGIEPPAGLVQGLVEAYRSHRPALRLAPDAARWLAAPDRPPPGLVTDGPLLVQTAKIRALDLERRLAPIFCTGTWGRAYWKPHARAFEAVENWSRLPGARHVYVADNPSKDFVTPRARGWLTVQIARPERVHHATPPTPAHRAHAVIASLDDLDACLAAPDRHHRAPG